MLHCIKIIPLNVSLLPKLFLNKLSHQTDLIKTKFLSGIEISRMASQNDLMKQKLELELELINMQLKERNLGSELSSETAKSGSKLTKQEESSSRLLFTQLAMLTYLCKRLIAQH